MIGRLLLVSVVCAGAASAADAMHTFQWDVSPILQKHCQSCHRPRSIAPMFSVSCKEARPWAKALKTAAMCLDAQNSGFPRANSVRFHRCQRWKPTGH